MAKSRNLDTIMKEMEEKLALYELEWSEVRDALMQAYLAGVEDGARRALMAR